MDLTWIEDFLALAATRNFSKAAARRNVTQPAFSRRIQRLELWAGARLLDRRANQVQLTPEGVRFKTVAEQSLAAIQIVRKEFEQARDEGGTPAIRFAALHTLALVLFPRWIGACERQIGPIRSSLMAANLAECVASLAAGECDFLLSYVDPDEQPSATKLGFSSLHITYDQLVPVSSVENGRPTLSLVGEAPIPYLSYGPDTLLGRLTQKALDRGGGQALLDVRYENSMSEALKVMALQGAGVAWLPVDSVGDDLQSGALALAGGEAWAVDLEVRIYRRRATLSKPAERLWRSLEAR